MIAVDVGETVKGSDSKKRRRRRDIVFEERIFLSAAGVWTFQRHRRDILDCRYGGKKSVQRSIKTKLSKTPKLLATGGD
jgi:hypothetical protein